MFDDDGYPYVLTDQPGLESWAESEETAEFTAGFDSDSRPLRLVFTDGEPALVVSGAPDVAAFRSLISAALARFWSPAPVDSLGPSELIGLLHDVS